MLEAAQTPGHVPPPQGDTCFRLPAACQRHEGDARFKQLKHQGTHRCHRGDACFELRAICQRREGDACFKLLIYTKPRATAAKAMHASGFEPHAKRHDGNACFK